MRKPRMIAAFIITAISLLLSACSAVPQKTSVPQKTAVTQDAVITVSDSSAIFSPSGDNAGQGSANDYLGSIDDVAAGELIDREKIDYADIDRYFTASEISDAVFARMDGKSYLSDSDISRDDLRYLRVLYNGYDENVHAGELVVNSAAAKDVLSVMKALFLGKYEISRMQLIDDYDADDEASMEADNTSAFNYRLIKGSFGLSNHAKGLAIDINPFENPSVTAAGTEPAGSQDYAYRGHASSALHMITHDDLCYRIFTAHGWKWGGDWNSSKDYMHFEIALKDIPADPDSVTLYPTVTKGSIGDSKIAQDSFDLINDIIQSDVENGFPGAQLAVIKDNKLIYSKAWGKTDAYKADGMYNSSGMAATTDTLYDLASNTKMYATDYAIQYLVSRGLLKTNMKISYILGDDFADSTIDLSYADYPNPGTDTQREWKSDLTLHDVLCHQAGFPADPQYNKPVFDQSKQTAKTDVKNILFAGNDGSDATRANTLQAIYKTPLMYEPGTKTLYSDVDYMLLGFIVEKVTGMKLDEFCRDTFYEPLGLSHITYSPLKNGFGKNDCAATELNGNTRDGHVFFDGIRTNTLQGEVHDEKAYYCMGGVSGHAGLFSNAEDLAKLATAMLNGGYGNDYLFSKQVISEFTAPADASDTDMGLGWWRQGNGSKKRYFSSLAPSDTIGHEGWTGTLTMIDPDNDLVIVFLTNKINTPLADSDNDLGDFAGNAYTAASLGFVPQLIYQGMKDDAAAENTKWLIDKVSEMQSKSQENDAAMKAYTALNNVLAGRRRASD